VAPPTDKSDAEILPEPELNPLLNPLLAAHMGRWAEVYFTSPPEKRAQAVSNLLRELKGGTSMEAAPVRPIVDNPVVDKPVLDKAIVAQPMVAQPIIDRTVGNKREVEAIETSRALSEKLPPPPLSPLVVDLRRSCGVCSADNGAEQKFCGMCGASLQSLTEAEVTTEPAVSEFHLNEPASEAVWSEPQSPSEPESSIERYSAEYAAEPPAFSFGGYARRDSRETEWSMPEADLPHFAVESESVPYRYRLYIGIAIAVVLGLLLYRAWRGTPGSSGDTTESVPSRVIPAEPTRAPPAEASRATSAPATTARTTAAASQQPPAKRVLPTEAATGAPPAGAAPAASRPAESLNQTQTTSRPEQTPKAAQASSHRVVSVAANSSVPAANDQNGNGEEELTTAEKYLNRSNYGGARDNQQAAQWLWKSVGKGNLTATITLSDLYLRGDGVPKSCDQARLLLVAAARKGKASAADRLRNLRAFGCQ
jgi:hypothetical protein